MTDGTGLPLAAAISAGPRPGSRYAEPVLRAGRTRQGTGRVRARPRAVAGDKGYSAAPARRYPRRRQVKAVIPTRKGHRRRPGCAPAV